jgi:hypothetical protein
MELFWLSSYFLKTEHWPNPKADSADYAFDGTIYTQTARTSGCNYPLREPVKAAFVAVRINEVPDANMGSPQGLVLCPEACANGKRQLANLAYLLDDVRVMVNTLVSWPNLGRGEQ